RNNACTNGIYRSSGSSLLFLAGMGLGTDFNPYPVTRALRNTYGQGSKSSNHLASLEPRPKAHPGFRTIAMLCRETAPSIQPPAASAPAAAGADAPPAVRARRRPW